MPPPPFSSMEQYSLLPIRQFCSGSLEEIAKPYWHVNKRSQLAGRNGEDPSFQEQDLNQKQPNWNGTVPEDFTLHDATANNSARGASMATVYDLPE